MARIETQDSTAAARAAVERELASGEHLIWFDRPRPWALARRDLPKSLFGIPFTAFAIFWVSAAYFGTSHAKESGPFEFFPLFGVPFIAVGLGLLLSPLWSVLKARSTIYAITDERLMIIEGLRIRRVTSYTSADIQQIERTERRDGSGDVVFRRELPLGRRNSISFGSFNATRIGFFGVADARRVETSVRQLAQGRKEAVPAS